MKTTDKDYKKILESEIANNAHRVIMDYRFCVEWLQELSREKERIVRQIDAYDISGNWQMDMFYNESKEKENDLNEYIQQAVDHISLAYEKGKYEGRDMASLFRGIFGLISEEALAKLEAKL